ncbi:short-chain dehydrogenase/reductase superfamily protein [Lepidopterella palustris CBS 459.81]|uniref:Short-chain dehydrogenase/reductase superfamily protein n=1 Tax=Lepidopterella palustris CBS 459.81 TaxID=1314670 RepID=A0A8E2E9Q3_9PEZI|nr:short-chain dehydrogenase/reductase superfamily protein [Lepidopterella palustris CBS 459.81]
MDIETISHTFQINAVATFTLIRTLLSNLRLAASGFSRPKVVIMSSRMGSVSYNNTGGGYAYRASKAALNAMVRSLSIDVPEVVFVLVHPGRVQTGLVPWKEDGAIQADESVKDMLGLIAKLSRDDSGRFMDRWGQDIGW